MQTEENEFSFKSLFVPFTTFKAIQWIIVIGIIVYANMLFNGFVWDDISYIVTNPLLHTINIGTYFGKNFFNGVGQYRPIPLFYFAILYQLFGNATFFYHIFGLTLHIVNVILIFLIFKQFFSKNISFFLSLIFLVHPMQVESVSYIASADNPLFFFFGVIALFLASRTNVSLKKYITITFMLLMSLPTKETGLLFLCVTFLYASLWKRKEVLSIFWSCLFAFIIYGSIRFLFAGIFLMKFQLVPIAQLTFVQRLINVPSIIFYYLKTFVFPLNLAINQQWIITKVDFYKFYLPLSLDILIFLCIILFGGVIYKKNLKYFKIYTFFSLCFLIGLVLHIQIFPLDGTVADRWFYFPLFGLLGMIGVLLEFVSFQKKKIISLTSIIIIIFITLFAMRTIIRNTDWSDPITLYLHDSKIADNYILENNLAGQYASSGNFQQALKHAIIVSEQLPDSSYLYNVGIIYEHLNNKDLAEKYYYKALSAKVFFPTSHKHSIFLYQRLGIVLIQLHKTQEAKGIIQEGLEDYPNDGTLFSYLAISDYLLGDKQSAINEAKKAKQLLKNSPQQTPY